MQYNDPDFEGGANEVSLSQARVNYAQLKAASQSCTGQVREPLIEEMTENK